MQLKTQFFHINNFLAPYQDVWQEEVLQRHPRQFDKIIESWIDELEKFNDEQLMAMENHFKAPDQASTAIKLFFEQLIELTRIKALQPKEFFSQDLHPSCLRIKRKKRHELHCLNHLINHRHLDFQRIIDIGGGVGHLSQYLHLHHQRPAVVVDRDEALKIIGKKRLQQYLPGGLDHISFLNLDLKQNNFKELLQKSGHESQRDLIMGLHSCGSLSTHLITQYAETHSTDTLINIGCCYLKLKDEFNISNEAQKHGLPFSYHALSLASRGYRRINIKDFQFRRRVKHYRYGLHLLFTERGQKDFVAVGSAPPKWYQDSFASYVHKCTERLKLTRLGSDQQLNSFLDSARIKEIDRMIAKVIFRFSFARAIELSLILDRALYLQERGKQAEIAEVFSPQLSPRNIAILAQSTNCN